MPTEEGVQKMAKGQSAKTGKPVASESASGELAGSLTEPTPSPEAFSSQEAFPSPSTDDAARVAIGSASKGETGGVAWRSVQGYGGWKYKQYADGRIMIDYDPRGIATGKIINPGDQFYDAIKGEVEELAGPMDPYEKARSIMGAAKAQRAGETVQRRAAEGQWRPDVPDLSEPDEPLEARRILEDAKEGREERRLGRLAAGAVDLNEPDEPTESRRLMEDARERRIEGRETREEEAETARQALLARDRGGFPYR